MQAIEALMKDGLSNRQIARETGMPLTNVHRIRRKLGIPPQRGIGFTGVPKVVEFLESLGHAVQIMPHLSRFDLLIDGERYELKCSSLIQGVRGATQFHFSLAGSASGAKDSDYVTVARNVAFKNYAKTCDFLLCAGFIDGQLSALYKLDSTALEYGKKRVLKINPGGQKYSRFVWYHVSSHTKKGA